MSKITCTTLAAVAAIALVTAAPARANDAEKATAASKHVGNWIKSTIARNEGSLNRVRERVAAPENQAKAEKFIDRVTETHPPK